ncbi:Mu transposase C-terminal domain-containing protein [Leisingera caerulea]|uniref:Mu transposase C-terminal domain-containing protein n=1 Tax=Leisingera caerulea TaxID=506591 RepID=UPI0021A2CBB0|nr:Mu transposase C-terminal domain-containing protein [Leisingera caerulea]UWQ50653.1 Mu transposase C-terminal domain-containing protein [Leisingera caerulea]
MLDISPSPLSTRYAFTPSDEILIDGREYQYFETRGNEHLFRPADGNGILQSFNNSQISRWLDKGKFEHKPGPTCEQATTIPTQLLSLFSAKEKERAATREALVLAFLELYDTKEVKRTDKSIKNMMEKICFRAGKIMKETTPPGMLPTQATPEEVSARSLRRWLKGYEYHGIAALYDSVSDRGNYDRRITDDERELMYRTVLGYLSDLKKSPANIVADVRAAFVAENEKRKAECLPELVCPSRITIRNAIASLDPFRVKLSRDGKDAARRAYSPVGQGIDVERPLQRVEMDEQQIDLISLMADSGLLNFFSDDEKAAFGLDGTQGRWWMTVALCVRTRCIIGMNLSRTPTAQSALRTAEMAMRDKGVWSDAVGALEPWEQFGMIGTLVTDCAKQFVGHDFRARMHDVGVNVLHTPAAAPWLKPYIERVFRTFSTRLMPRLSGCTFGDILRRGSSNPEEKAALTADQLCAVLVRWIVDIYHNTPHEGLDGETPRNCWHRLTAKYGVTPPPSLPRRRLIFGQEISRVLHKDGITVLGVRYHSKTLAQHMMHSNDTQMVVRWYPEDIGAIWVKIGDAWCPVNAVHKRFHGVSAQQWLIARRQLRFQHECAAKAKASVVQKALDFVAEQNGLAMKRVGVVQQDWSADRIEREEQAMFTGFGIAEDEDELTSSIAEHRWGEALPTAASTAQAAEEKVHDPAEISSVPAEPFQFPVEHHPASSDGDDDDGEFLTLWDK